MNDLTVLAAQWPEDSDELVKLRTQVFVDEQKVPTSLEIDGLDAESQHVKALIDGVIVGTGRLLPNGFIGRMCVLSEYRGQGIGTMMLENLVQQARDNGHQTVSLNSQSSVIPFYEKFGFTIESEEFVEAGIPHRLMTLKLREDTSGQLLDGRSDCLNCAKTLIGLAQQRVYIIGQDLEADLYNYKSIYDHLAGMATRNRKTDIRLIAHDTRVATTNGHYLILLTQKLPTFAQIRTTANPEHRKFRENWLIIDDMAFMRLKNPQRYEGYFELDNKLECRSLTEDFIDIWEAGQIDQNTRRLSL